MRRYNDGCSGKKNIRMDKEETSIDWLSLTSVNTFIINQYLNVPPRVV